MQKEFRMDMFRHTHLVLTIDFHLYSTHYPKIEIVCFEFLQLQSVISNGFNVNMLYVCPFCRVSHLSQVIIIPTPKTRQKRLTFRSSMRREGRPQRNGNSVEFK